MSPAILCWLRQQAPKAPIGEREEQRQTRRQAETAERALESRFVSRMTTITLTFDNGPDPDVTPLVLDTLRRHDIRSTFFVLGENMQQRRSLAERAHADGHWIGNHTFHHKVPLGMIAETGAAAAEIARTEALIGDLAHPRRFFRPFGGGGQLDRRLLNGEALHYLRENAYTCVLWNVIAHDWSEPIEWVERALALSFARPHALVVLHDLPTGAMRGLDRFVATARERGAVFQQDFPWDCVPIERGQVVGSIEAYVSEHGPFMAADQAAPEDASDARTGG
jgi:peptidoglycan-N-acetylglucosamine deacetylase